MLVQFSCFFAQCNPLPCPTLDGYKKNVPLVWAAVSGTNPQLWPSVPTLEKSLNWHREGHWGVFTTKMRSTDGSDVGILMTKKTKKRRSYMHKDPKT